MVEEPFVDTPAAEAPLFGHLGAGDRAVAHHPINRGAVDAQVLRDLIQRQDVVPDRACAGICSLASVGVLK